MHQNFLAFSFLLLSLTGFAQQEYPLVEHPQVLDLRYAEVYEYNLQLPEHSIAVPASKLDWEKVVAEAGAMLDLKTVLLPEKELLFSFALNLELLTGMQTSIFWYRKTRYAEFLKKWLTTEEIAYFDTVRKQLDEWGDYGLSRIALWKQLIHQTTKAEQFEVFGDSLLAYSYRVKGHDAEEFEAILQAYWGLAYASEGKAAKAAPHLQRCFDLRRRRGDVLTYSIDRLIQAYVKSEQIDSALQVCREVMDYARRPEFEERQVAYYSLWQVMNFEAQYGNPQRAFEFYEQVYLSLAQQHHYYYFIWDEGQQLPYYHAIKAAGTDEQRLAYFKRWGKAIKLVEDEQKTVAAYELLLFSKKYEHKQLADLMKKYFEEYFIQAKLDWADEPEKHWDYIMPYRRLLQYKDSLAEKVKLLEYWMDKALETNYKKIIKQTARSVSSQLITLGEIDIAFTIYEKYFLTYLNPNEDNYFDWIVHGLYGKLDEKDKPVWEKKWLTLAKKYADEDIVLKVYWQIAQYYYHKEEYEVAFEWYDALLEYQSEVNNCRYGYSAYMATNSRWAKQYYRSLKYTIRLFECDYVGSNNYGFSTLNTVVAAVYKDEGYAENTKLQKAFLKRLKKWKRTLKKRGTKWEIAYRWANKNIQFLKNHWR